jgi:competence protein ComEC
MKKIVRNKRFIYLIAILVIAVASGAFGLDNFDKVFEVELFSGTETADTRAESFEVHYIDVGQGDCSLIICDGKTMLVDAGENGHETEVLNYLRLKKIDKLDYVIASHQHTDHIGGLLNVLDVYEVENIIMPKLSSINTPTTKTYENFLLKIKEKGIKVIAAKFGEKYYINNTVLETFAPLEQDKDLNNMSVVCRISAFGTSFLFPGDASISELNDFYKRGTDFSCDVIAAAHHGSNESLHKNFLTRCNPDIVVYSCGEDNSYGHPHEEVVDFFDDLGTKSYRTDIVGSLLFTCDEDGYTVKEKGRTR